MKKMLVVYYSWSNGNTKRCTVEVEEIVKNFGY